MISWILATNYENSVCMQVQWYSTSNEENEIHDSISHKTLEATIYLFIISSAYNLFQSVERPRSNEEDVCGIHGNNIIGLSLTGAFIHNIDWGSFEDFEQPLLYPLPSHVSEMVEARDTADFVNLI